MQTPLPLAPHLLLTAAAVFLMLTHRLEEVLSKRRAQSANELENAA